MAEHDVNQGFIFARLTMVEVDCALFRCSMNNEPFDKWTFMFIEGI